MQQPMNTNPVQVIVVAQPMMIDKQIQYRNMKTSLARQLIGLGIMQLIIGILCIIFQGVAVRIYTSQLYSDRIGIDYIGHGFWTGILFLITGSVGIAGGIKRSRCQVVAFNVLSILSALFTACLMAIAIPGAVFYTYGGRRCDYDSSNNYRCYSTGTSQTGVAMEAMMAILGLMEFIIAIRSSVICCKIGACCCNCGCSCCCPPAPLQNQFLMAGQPFLDQQQIVFANQQPQMFTPSQPFSPNSQQQLMFSPNQQQPMFLVNPQQQIVNFDPRQQIAQYQPQPPHPPPYGQQASDYTSLSPDAKDQDSSYTGLYNSRMKDTMVYPEQPRDSAYEDYDRIENGAKYLTIIP